MFEDEFANMLTDKLTDKFLSVAEAAEILGVNTQRIRALINAPCPICKGTGTDKKKKCHRCFGTGQRLPAQRVDQRTWIIPLSALDINDIKNRKPGQPI
ncbi:MAG: helix-turn-helix domain-containing protein [Candidatus Omnitrophica bacterium]|nr:helix-turn-helix domain-containing protein [Candidatus Omnitrophota bacterium]